MCVPCPGNPGAGWDQGHACRTEHRVEYTARSMRSEVSGKERHYRSTILLLFPCNADYEMVSH